MKTSENIDKIAPAFIKAQSSFGKARKSAANPFFKSKYADLNEYLEVCLEGLKDNGIALLQDTGGSESAQIISVTTRLIHSSGQWFESEPLILHPTDMKPQSFGSAQTYGRRYSLAAFLGLGAEDDDGNKASEKKTMPTRASVNGELLELKTKEEYQNYAKAFNKTHGGGVWGWSSNKRGNKSETWKMLFETHRARVSGIPPVNAKQTPEEIQSEWAKMADTCQDSETLAILEKDLNQNKCLDTEENLAILEELHKTFS